MNETNGRKEVSEAVLVATLCAVATGVVGIGMEMIRQMLFSKPELKKPPPSKE